MKINSLFPKVLARESLPKKAVSYTTKRPSKYSNIGTLKNPPFSKKIYVIIRDPAVNPENPVNPVPLRDCLFRQTLSG